MPIYQGGKAKIGKEIAEFIEMMEDVLEWEGQYFEPFCGLLGVGIHLAEEGRKVVASDLNKDLILMLKAVKRGWDPPKTCSRKKFDEYKNSKKHSAERGFYGFGCSYQGIFFTSYRVRSGKRNFFSTFRKSLLDMRPALQNVTFFNKSYQDFNPKGMTIYCDPPYMENGFGKGTKFFAEFDFDLFWSLMRKWSKHNLVLVSEYQAPNDFICVWEKGIKSGFVGNTNRKNRVEKLFMYKGK